VADFHLPPFVVFEATANKVLKEKLQTFALFLFEGVGRAQNPELIGDFYHRAV
jgi:hypothetical protein